MAQLRLALALIATVLGFLAGLLFLLHGYRAWGTALIVGWCFVGVLNVFVARWQVVRARATPPIGGTSSQSS